MPLRVPAAMVCFVSAVSCAPPEPAPAPLGTAEDRDALVRDIVTKTMARTAWSPYTEGAPS